MIRETVLVKTKYQTEMVNITDKVQKFVEKNNINEGRITLFVPHTTAGITINENCDPDVQTDLNKGIRQIIPAKINVYHNEGNSDAHLMSSLVGVTQDVFVENGRLLLGTWQGIYFWEFDGPRDRKVYIIG